MADDIQWHSPFRGAVKIELSEYSNILEYVDEKALTKKPLFIDLLVIKKRTNKKINNPIGNIFKGWNLWEYKSPKDRVTINDFYKASAYAYLLKSGTAKDDQIKFDNMTLSFFSKKPPTKLFNHLERVRKYDKSQYAEGIYYFMKDGEIPVQFIIQKTLDEKHRWLASLTDQISKELLQSLVIEYNEAEKNEHKDAVLDAVFKANPMRVKELMEEKDMRMSREIRELFRPELEDAEGKGKAEGRTELLITIVKKKRLRGLEAEQIAELLEMDEEHVKEIVALIDQFPKASAAEISKKLLHEFERQLA